MVAQHDEIHNKMSFFFFDSGGWQEGVAHLNRSATGQQGLADQAERWIGDARCASGPVGRKSMMLCYPNLLCKETDNLGLVGAFPSKHRATRDDIMLHTYNICGSIRCVRG